MNKIKIGIALAILMIAAMATPAMATESEKRAVIIGVDDGLGDGPYNDAYAVKYALMEIYGWNESDIRVMTDDLDETDPNYPNRTNVLFNLEWLAGATDSAVLYYSGHGTNGVVDPDDDGEVLDEGIVLTDGILWDGEIADKLAGMTTPAWIMFDTCKAGGYDDVGVTSENRVITLSSNEGQLSWQREFPEGVYGVFTYFMVYKGILSELAEDINEDGWTSIEEAFEYAKNNMVRQDKRQKIQMIDTYDGELVP